MSQKLPSRHQLGDKVFVDFASGGVLYDCKIIKVHFSESKVLYDLEVYFLFVVSPSNELYGQKDSTRIYNVDSVFVNSIEIDG